MPTPEARSERRRLLASEPNPSGQVDYVVRLEADLGTVGKNDLSVRLCYVPDRDILQPAALETYLALLSQQPWLSLEAMTLAMLDDLNNEIVPRWTMIEIRAGKRAGMPQAVEHSVVVEDRQPGWSNPELLAQQKRG
ncbi:MAG: hypothetical protein HYR63_14725 [Proteobacteria bacterium]|nr:hypothetical protein [Pseudomonadota bacterium]MBI3498765.1 hypothetical protein [Pseudomonadota bacterium]